MGAVVKRTTVEYRESVNTPDYSEVDWIVNPDLSALAGVPHKYWKVVGDTVVEMDAGEKAAVDAAEVAAQQASIIRQRKVDTVPMVVVADSIDTIAWKLIAKVPFQGSLYPDDITINLVVNGYTKVGSSGSVRVYDATNAKELGKLAFTADKSVIKTAALSNIAMTKDAVIEIHGIADGVGQIIHVDGAALEVYR